MSYDVQILVNGSRCKQHIHDGKTFIEAKHGSEYTIEIKNNTWTRILAVCSVDGLDILNGKTATEEGPGYVINGYNSGKFDGFRVSNDKVAKFVFSTKGASYASSKEDGSERNVGVIGIRLFEEKVKPLPPVTEIHHHHTYRNPYNPVYPPTIWEETIWKTTYGDTRGTYGSNTSDVRGSTLGMDEMIGDCINDSADASCDWMETLRERGPSAPSGKGSATYSCDNIPTKGGSSGPSRTLSSDSFQKGIKGRYVNSSLRAMNLCGMPETKKASFDMGTKWGEAKESKVVEVEFEKGVLALTTNIYYASRQSLIDMGVPLGNEKQVSFPEPFANSKYSKPPKGWRS